MPYRRTYYKKKRRYRKKRNNFRNRKYRLRKWGKIKKFKLNSPSMLPDNVMVKLKYVDFIKMTNVAGLGTYRFHLNSAFDPDAVALGGTQPMGYDQWTQFYNHYQVSASSIRCQILAPDTNVTGFAIYPSNNITAATSYAQAREQPYSKHCWVTNQASSQSSIVRNYMKVKKFEGRSIDSVNFAAPISGNPSSLRYWQLVLQSTSGTDISDIIVDVLIVYYVKFFRRITLSQST